jgi:hypothetical protein
LALGGGSTEALELMNESIAAPGRPIVALVTVPFVALNVLDGLWKPALLKSAPITYWTYDLAKWVLLPITLVWLLHRTTDTSPRAYGLSADLGLKDLLLLVPLPLTTLVLAYTFGFVVAGPFASSSAPAFHLDSPLNALGPLAVLGTLYLAITAGLWESIFFIGLPWLWLSMGRTTRGPVASAFLPTMAILFAISHFESGWRDVSAAFFFQLVAFYWYFRLRTLWPVIGAHTLIDIYLLWPPASA